MEGDIRIKPDSTVGEIPPDVSVRFVSLSTLIKMKKISNRARDIDDVEHLEMLRAEKDNNDTNT